MRVSSRDVVIAGRYRLVKQIAVGGMSKVWTAWDERLHRRVAVKLLHPQTGFGAAEAQLAGQRAMREARITARLHHPNAVPVYDVVDHDGAPCLVMQYVPSRSLQSIITEKGTLDVPAVARIGSEVAAALVAAHEAGIVHRDVKPGNVLIAEDGKALLTDFGISHALGDVTLTSTGMVTGTPAFLAPEVARGDPSGFPSDVFSLGATLYAALEGTPPFGTADNPMAVLHRVASGQVNPPRRSGVLTPVLASMLQLEQNRRPSTAEAAASLAAAAAAAADPVASADTQRITSEPAVPPPSTTVTLPPAKAAATSAPPAREAAVPTPLARRPARSGRWRLLAVVLAVFLLAGAAVVLITQLGGSGSPAASGPSTSASTRQSTSPRSSTHSSSRHSSSQQAVAHSTSTSRSSPRTAGSRTRTSATASDTTAGSPSAALVQAIESYYALLPGDTNTAWPRLTASYQQNTAHGRASYDRFWNLISTVAASNVTATGSSTVVATITYGYKDGRVYVERTSFELLQEGGTYKINKSSVLSSQ